MKRKERDILRSNIVEACDKLRSDETMIFISGKGDGTDIVLSGDSALIGTDIYQAMKTDNHFASAVYDALFRYEEECTKCN